MQTKPNIKSFIPEEYKEPSAGDNYMKIKQGENRIRILSPLVMGWEDWTEDKKPIRFRYDQKPEFSINPERKIKLFWAFVVWNYAESKLQILQVTQSSIRKAIHKLSEDSEWGNPFFYDLKISRSGDDINTVYVVVPAPHSNVSNAIKEAYQARPINLEALFDNKDPFEIAS